MIHKQTISHVYLYKGSVIPSERRIKSVMSLNKFRMTINAGYCYGLLLKNYGPKYSL